MGRKRKLKKVCCDQEIQEQNVVASKLASGEPKVDETSSQCSWKLVMEIVSNPSDEIPRKKNWEFQSQSGRLNYLKIYIN